MSRAAKLAAYALGTEHPYLQAAYMAYNNRMKVAMVGRYAGRKAYKAYGSASRRMAKFKRKVVSRKKSARHSMRRIANPIGTSTCKSREGIAYVDTPASRQLVTFDIVSKIPKDGDDNLNARQRNAVNLSGFKYCIHVRNNEKRPMTFHFAVCVDKRHGGSNYTDDFFRSQGEGNRRSTNFSNVLSGMDMKCCPINTDRYIVLRHSRLNIGPADADNEYNATGPKNYLTLERYMRVKRQIRYDGAADSSAQTRILCFVWADLIDAAPDSSGVADAMHMHVNLQTYFRDIK